MHSKALYPVRALCDAVFKLSGGRLRSDLLAGADKVSVSSIAPLSDAAKHEISFLASQKYLHEVKTTKAGVIVMRQNDMICAFGESPDRPVVVTDNPYAWFAFAMQAITSAQNAVVPAVSARASVDPTAEVSPKARIDDGAVIEAGARIADGVWIGANSVVAKGSCIGENTRLYPNVTVNHGCRIGKNCILHSGCVIGADGFGFAPFNGTWVKIPQIGGVTIGNDVEVGANTCVDRGALEDTVVGDGVKLDNLIQIAHNVHLGMHTVMAGAACVAGSTKIGSHVIVGGRANINGHITVPDNATVGPASNIVSFPDDKKLLMGFYPAMDRGEFERSAVLLKHLPDMRRSVRELKAKLEKLENKLEK